jgi:hypothetical protein
MMSYDSEARRRLAADRAERLADDYARANARTYRRRRRRQLPLAAGLELAERARRWASRPQLQG